MGKDTKIEWAKHTFNIVWGCTKVSEACASCYAEALAKRFGHSVWGADKERRKLGEAYWKQPLKWNAAAGAAGVRERVFCSSMADVFEDHPTVAEERQKLWPLIESTPNLNWLLLTKRPENMLKFTPWSARWPSNIWAMCTRRISKD
jgi:protein gp37